MGRAPSAGTGQAPGRPPERHGRLSADRRRAAVPAHPAPSPPPSGLHPARLTRAWRAGASALAAAFALLLAAGAAEADSHTVPLTVFHASTCAGCPAAPAGTAEPGPGSGEITLRWTWSQGSRPAVDHWQLTCWVGNLSQPRHHRDSLAAGTRKHTCKGLKPGVEYRAELTAFTASARGSSTMAANLKPENQLKPDAGEDATVRAGARVELDGTGSWTVRSGATLTYAWRQTAGPTVRLAGATSAKPVFIAPLVSSSTDFTFELTVGDGISTEETDTVTVTVLPSRVVSASVSGDVLTVTFDAALKTSARPASSAFTVTASKGGASRAIAGASSLVTISNKTVTAALSAAVAGDERLTVRYDKPASGAVLEDSTGTALPGFAGRAAGNTGDTTPPTVESVRLNGAKATVIVSEALDESSTPGDFQFKRGVGGAPTGATNIVVAGNVVTMVMDVPATHGEAIRFHYVPPTTGVPLQDLAGNALEGVHFGAVTPTNNTPPAFESASVDGDALTVTFDGRLDPNSRPAAAAFTVTVGGSEVALAATNPVSISGSTVTLALGEAVLSTETVTVGYTAPAVKPLRDADKAKNPVPDFTGKAVTNSTPADTTPPTVESVRLNGAKATVIVSEALDESSTPGDFQFKRGVGGPPTGATNIVVAGNVVTMVMDVPATHGEAIRFHYVPPTTGVPLQDLAGNALEGVHFGAVTPTNNTPPAFESASVDGDALTVTFDGRLDPNSRPAAAAFTVTVGGSEVALAATNPVSIGGTGGKTVTLALAQGVLHGQTVTVGYTKPADNPLRDSDNARLPVTGFGDTKTVTNDTPADTTGPAFVSATANGKTVTVTFDEGLDETVTPAWTQFGLVLDEDAGGVSVGGSIAGRTVTLRFLSPVTHGATVKVSYNPSSVPGERIKNLSGIEAPAFQQQPVTNNTAPAFSSASVDGDALTVRFDGGLDANSRPAAAAFTVTVAGTEVALAATNPVSVSGARVRLALAEAVYPVHTVTVGYAAPATGNKLKDADGAKNPVADFTGKAVRNDTDLGDTTGPRFVSATALDDTVVFTYDEELYASANLDRRLFQRNVGDSGAISLATTISVSGNTVTATYVALGVQPGPVRHGDAVWVRYQSSTDATKRLTDLSGNEATGFNLRSATNNTPPAFASAAVDGDALTITFDGDLDANSRPAADAFTVKAGGNEVALAAANPVAISESTVTLALAEAVYPAHTVTVRYTKPAGNPLRDADNARLPVTGFGDKKTVTNNTDLGDTTAPAMVSREIDGRTLTITYNEPLDESSVPAASRLSAAIGGVGRGPASIRVAGEVVTLTFRADHAARHDQFVAMTYAKQSATKRLRDRSGNQAPGFIGLSVTNNTPPAFHSASLNGNALQVTFTGNLDSESRPAADAFTVTVDGAEVALTTGAVGVSGTFATMTLAEPVTASLVPVTVGYTAPAENPLRDADRAKRPVASFSGKAVTNNTASDTTPPMLQSAAVDGETMTLTFGEALDPGSVPPAGSFGVMRGASAAKAPTGVGVAGSTVTLTLAAADAPIRGDAVAVTYSKPTGAGAKPLRDLSANPVAGFTNAVTNNSGVSTPLFASASVNGTALTVRFDRALDGTRVPANAAFTVTAGGVEVAVADGGVAVGGSAVTLTLAGAVAYGQAVTVGYDRSAAGSATLRDARGSEAESFAGEEVANVTPAPAATIASVTIESVPSIDADSDGTPETYARGEQIRVRVTWSTDVLWDVSGAGAGMSVGLDVGGTARAARLLSADGSRGRARSLSFGYTVAPEDRDADGIVIARTVAHDVVALSGGATLKDALGRDAVRGGTGAFGRAEGHQVDGSRTAPDKAPALVGATVSGKTLTLTFDEDLAAPADTAETLWALRTAFFVQGGRYQGAPVIDQSPTRVVVSGPTVTLTLGSGVGAGRPDHGELREARGPAPAEGRGRQGGGELRRAWRSTTPRGAPVRRPGLRARRWRGAR